MAEKQSETKFFLATLTISLSDRSFPDFIRTGANSNYLPEFQARLATLQTQLEAIEDKTIGIRSQEQGFELSNPIALELSNFSVTSLSYVEGSVVAKIQIGCKVVAATTAFLAAYPAAKVGYTELRDDLIAIATDVFEDIQEGSPDREEDQQRTVSYYFLRPEKAEENLIKRALEVRPDSFHGDEETDMEEEAQTTRN